MQSKLNLQQLEEQLDAQLEKDFGSVQKSNLLKGKWIDEIVVAPNNHATHLFNSILEENPNYTEKQILDRGRCLLQSALRSRLHYETMLLCDKLDVSRDDLINGCREQPLATKRAVIAAILVEKRYSITSVYNELHLHNSTVHHALGVVRDGLEVGDKLIMELYRKGKE